MSRRLLGALLVVAFAALLGCHRKAKGAAAAEAAASASACIEAADAAVPAPVTAPITAPVTAPITATDAPDAAAPEFDPYAGLVALDDQVADRRVGFTGDDRSLVYEVSTCDPCPSAWTFVTPGAPERRLAYFYDPTLEEEEQARRRKQDGDVDRKLTELGIGKARDARHLRGPFPYAGLAFATKTTRNETTGRVTLHFGGRLGEGEPVYPLKVTLGPHPVFRAAGAAAGGAEMYDPALAYANVTKDGKEIGIVVIAGGNFWYEAGGVARMPTATFVAQLKRH